jgi:hypothetical protein
MNHLVEELTQNITKTCDLCLKQKKQNIRSNGNKWWTDRLSALRREVNRLRRQYQRCQTNRRPELQNNYKNIKQKYEKILIETKTKSSNQFVVDSTRDNAWGLVYKIAKKSLKNEKICELIGINGQTLTASEAIADTLLEVLFPRDESTT